MRLLDANKDQLAARKALWVAFESTIDGLVPLIATDTSLSVTNKILWVANTPLSDTYGSFFAANVSLSPADKNKCVTHCGLSTSYKWQNVAIEPLMSVNPTSIFQETDKAHLLAAVFFLLVRSEVDRIQEAFINRWWNVQLKSIMSNLQ